MSKNQDMERLWQTMCKLDAELVREGRECGKRGELTERYKNLKKDCDKAREEYHRLSGKRAAKSFNISEGEAYTTRRVLGELTGRFGSDSHVPLED